MRAMSPADRQRYVERQTAERKRLQGRINRLNEERNEFVTQRRQELAEEAGQKTLDQALVEAIRSQASQKRFIFE
jgi:hypothetical protein